MFAHVAAGIRHTFIAFGVLLAAGVASAQPVTPKDFLPDEALPGLKALMVQASNQSPRAIKEATQVARAEAQRLIDASQLWPQVSGTFDYSVNDSKDSEVDGPSNRNVGLFYNVSVNQPLFHWGALKAQATIGKLGVQIAEENYEEMYKQLMLAVRSQYLSLITQKIALNYQRMSLSQSEASLRVLEEKLRNGAASPAQLAEPRLSLAELRIETDRMTEDYAQSRRTLAVLCGVEEIDEASIPSEFPVLPGSLEEFQRLASLIQAFEPDDLPQARIYQAYARQGELNYKIARARILPKFNAFASAGQNNNAYAAGGAVTQSSLFTQRFGVMASWTIFDGFAARGSKAIALSQRRTALRDLEEFRNTMLNEAQVKAKSITFARRTHDVLQTRFDISRNSTDKVAADVREGLAAQEFLDNVRNTQNSTELRLLKARADLWDDIASFLSLLGVDPALENIPARYLSNARK